ncbi:MAG: PTS sugar transporter subunit IIA [Treponema sp.]|nr:PTS sugar transporter subunit IIA [Treponema sp.]
MFLHDVFPPECIIVNLESEDKDEVFEEMVDFFCQVHKLDAREDILNAIREREAKMSTGIQKGIAIPHGKCDAVDRVYGAIGISGKGIDYDALDGEPVYLLFLVIAPRQNTEQHLKVLKHLAELMENHQFYTDLQSQKDAQGAYKIISKYEDMIIALE